MRKFNQVNLITSVALSHDIMAAALAWWFSYLLHFNFSIPSEHLAQMVQSLFWAVPIQASLFVSFGLYRGVWRFASVNDLKRIVFAVVSATALVTLVLFMFQTGLVIPRSVLILNPILLILMIGGSGFVGKALCAEMYRQGHAVLGTVRSMEVLNNIEQATVKSIDSVTKWSKALVGVNIVIH